MRKRNKLIKNLIKKREKKLKTKKNNKKRMEIKINDEHI